jgi:hypothetical protein
VCDFVCACFLCLFVVLSVYVDVDLLAGLFRLKRS